MQDLLSSGVPAIIALVGTIMTAAIGYNQWKRQHDTTLTNTYTTERQAAYKELWTKLEEVHVKVRINDVTQQDFDKLLNDVNSFVMKHSLYLSHEDQILANTYLEAVYKFTKLVRESKDEAAERQMYATAALSVDEFQRGREINLLAKEADRIRNTIVERFRQIVEGKKG